jgi:hypothetical protein
MYFFKFDSQPAFGQPAHTGVNISAGYKNHIRRPAGEDSALGLAAVGMPHVPRPGFYQTGTGPGKKISALIIGRAGIRDNRVARACPAVYLPQKGAKGIPLASGNKIYVFLHSFSL